MALWIGQSGLWHPSANGGTVRHIDRAGRHGMATPKENVALIRKGFEAFNKGDVEALSTIIAKDCVQHLSGDNRFTGDHKGLDNCLAMYGELAAESDATFRAELERVYANDHRAVANFRSTATRKGKKLDQQSTLVFEITGGKITDLDELALDAKVDDPFWA